MPARKQRRSQQNQEAALPAQGPSVAEQVQPDATQAYGPRGVPGLTRTPADIVSNQTAHTQFSNARLQATVQYGTDRRSERLMRGKDPNRYTVEDRGGTPVLRQLSKAERAQNLQETMLASRVKASTGRDNTSGAETTLAGDDLERGSFQPGTFYADDRREEFRDQLSPEYAGIYKGATDNWKKNFLNSMQGRETSFSSIEDFDEFVRSVPGWSPNIGGFARDFSEGALKKFNPKLHGELEGKRDEDAANRDSFDKWVKAGQFMKLGGPYSYDDPEDRGFFEQDRNAEKFRFNRATGDVEPVMPKDLSPVEQFRETVQQNQEIADEWNESHPFGPVATVVGDTVTFGEGEDQQGEFVPNADGTSSFVDPNVEAAPAPVAPKPSKEEERAQKEGKTVGYTSAGVPKVVDPAKPGNANFQTKDPGKQFEDMTELGKLLRGEDEDGNPRIDNITGETPELLRDIAQGESRAKALMDGYDLNIFEVADYLDDNKLRVKGAKEFKTVLDNKPKDQWTDEDKDAYRQFLLILAGEDEEPENVG